MEKLVLIDGNSLLNRAFYATPIFSTALGQPTNAIFGFTKLMLKIIRDLKPEYMIVTFDMKAPTFRHKMYDGYKANRSPMPDELASQVEPLRSLLSAMNIAMCYKEGLEADDLIGTLSRRFDVHSYIYTGDRDSFQLVDEKTDVFYTKRGVSDLLKLSVDNFYDEIGMTPPQVVDFKALMGDKSDNIPGVAGVGESSARNLLSQFSTLDELYANLDAVQKPSLRKKLEEGKESAYLSYKLATIDRNCDLNVDLNNCRVPNVYSSEVRKLFEQFEFKSLLGVVEFDDGETVTRDTEIVYPNEVKLGGEEDFRALCEKGGSYYLDLRSDCAKIYYDGVQYSIEFGAEDLFCIFSQTQFLECLSLITKEKSNKIILFDYKNLLHVLSEIGVNCVCDFDDVGVLNYLVDYFDESKTLKSLCDAKGYDYNFSAFALYKSLIEYNENLVKDDLAKLYEDIEKPLVKVLFDMEKTGVTVDSKQLSELGNIYLEKVNELKVQIYEACGCTFNINSPTQLGEVLFEKLGLKSGKKNKMGKYSTSAEVLETLAADNECVRLILRYRQYQKLYSTYIEGFRPLIDKKTQLVHTHYNQTVTTTGRLSSTNPNLQNIPIREEEGRELRKVFVPREGRVLIDADYSQIELRLLAHFSGCKELIAAYSADEDVHAVTASQVFGVPLNEVTPRMRREAKAVNFGIIYGISEFGLSKNLQIGVKTAKEYIEKYFERYSAVKEYMQSNVEFAKKNGYVATLTGRKRYIKEINSSNYNLRQFGERAAMNMPLQGSSADIIKIAMINVANALNERKMQTKLILQVHDELVLDSPKEEAETAAELLKDCMENSVQLNVPLKVEVHCGKNWYEAK